MSDSNGAAVSRWMVKETLAAHLAPLLERYDVKWRGHGRIYVDYQHENIYTAHIILMELSANLGVPVQLIRSRLIELEWLNDVRSALPVRNDLPRIIDRLAPRATADAEEDDSEIDEEFN